MVTGAAALLFDAYPHRTVGEIKSLLMNTAETKIYNNLANTPGYLAPITRIGGGEVRVDRALKSPAAAWDRSAHSGDLSFGFVDVTKQLTTLSKWVRIRNYSNRTLRYAITPKFRYANDRTNGAVKITAPTRVTIAPHSQRTFKVTVRINGPKLRDWALDSGAAALDARALDQLEYDGYLTFNNLATHKDDQKKLHMAWHILPRLSGKVTAASTSLVADGTISGGPFDGVASADTTLTNSGVGTATVDQYSLVGTSPALPPAVRGSNQPVIDLRSVGVQTFPVPGSTACDAVDSFVYVIAVNDWERETVGSFPGQIAAFLDTKGNTDPDYLVFNAPLSGPATTGDVRTLTWVQNLDTGDATAYFFADHATNDSNMVLPFCADQIGLDADALGSTMTMHVAAFDAYYTGNLTDLIEDIGVGFGTERFLGIFGGTDLASTDIAPHTTADLTIADFGTVGTNPSETGVLLIDNATRGDTRGGSPKGWDALRIDVAGAP